MNTALQRRTAHSWTGLMLIGAAFFIPISIAPAQFFLYGAILTWLVATLGNRQTRMPFSPTLIPLLLFLACLIFSAITGLDPGRSVRKLHRFVLLPLIFIIPWLAQLRHRVAPAPSWHLLVAFMAGATCLACYDFVRVPLHLLEGGSYYEAGNMRDPQFYLVAIVMAVACLLTWPNRSRLTTRLLLLVLACCMLAFFLHNKRGAWMSFGVALCAMSLLARRGMYLRNLLLAAAAFILLAEAGVRLFHLPHELSPIQRLADIEREFAPTQGGRISMWRNIAPDAIREHPTGIGFKASTWIFLRSYHWNIALGLDHLHNNALQIALATGWLGIAAWLLWMAWVLLRCIRARPPNTYSLAAFASLLGLLCNGLFEYNFGDSEIYMLYLLLLGLAELGTSREQEEQS